MKKINYLSAIVLALLIAASCNKVTYKKAKSGMAYKIFSGSGKDSLIKDGQVVKYNVQYKLNDDSLLFTSYGKAPQYIPIQPGQPADYTLVEIFPMMKKGDSGVVVLMIDTLLKRGNQFPFPYKKGDRIVGSFRIIEVFQTDSIARADFDREMEKDKPRRDKEQQEQMAKLQKEQEEQQKKEDEQLEKSGEIAKEFKEIETYLAVKKINAQKTGKGTYVYIKEQGTGAQAVKDKFVNVKYTGRILRTDSTFESNSYPFQLGKAAVIRGWDEGLLLFKQGGKGTLFVPGFLAYGKNPGPGSRPYEALVFDVELLNVSDTMITQPMRPPNQ